LTFAEVDNPTSQKALLQNPASAEERTIFDFVIPEIAIDHVSFYRQALCAEVNLARDLGSPGAFPEQALGTVD
jgi:hypothetical protein